MGIWDPPKPKENKRKLTQTQILKIKNAAGKCENCPSPDPHDVHHINGDRSDDSYNNLIVLCGSCHKNAEGKSIKGTVITKERLIKIVRERPNYKKVKIKEALTKKTIPKKMIQTFTDLRVALEFNFRNSIDFQLASIKKCQLRNLLLPKG